MKPIFLSMFSTATEPRAHGSDPMSATAATDAQTCATDTTHSAQLALNPASSPRHKKEGGFTMAEVMAVLVVIGIMATVALSLFSGETTKGTRLLTDMKTFSDGMTRVKLDTGSLPRRMDVLWDRSQAIAANMFGGVGGQNGWNGPYVERMPVDATNAQRPIQLNAVADGVLVTLEREAASAANGGQYSWVYFMRATNVPNGIITAYMQKCTSLGEAEALASTFLNSNCRATPGTGATEFGTVDWKVTDSR